MAFSLVGNAPRKIVLFDDPGLTASTYGGALEVSHGQLYLTVSDYQSDF